MATWADIQRLVADLQRVQSTDSAKKLSEANCVEIIYSLINSNAINVVVTTNGKEYVTKKHLITEVKNECLAAGGRINITDLVPILRIDLDHIENAASTLTTDYPDEFILCSGELVSRDYITDVCKRLNECLQGVGQISMFQLAKNWDLPTEFLNHYVLSNLGAQIDATRFEDQIYTRRFYQLQRNKLRAALASLTKPTILSTIYAAFEIPQALFFNIWNELSEIGHLNGHLIGSKGSLKSVFVPKMHDLLVKAYVKNAFLSNDYVETSTLKKLSIANTQSYFKDLLPKEKFNECIFLQSGVVHQDLWQQAIRSIEEHVQAELFCSIEQHLPSALSDLSDSDIESLINALKKSHPTWSFVSADEHIAYDRKLIEKTLSALEPWLQEKAKEDAPSLINKMKAAQTQQAKKTVAETSKKPVVDDDDDWGNEKGGKKKGGKGAKKAPASKAKSPPQTNAQQSSSQPDIASILKLPTDELEQQIQSTVTAPDSLFAELLEHVQQPANQKYKEIVEATIRAVDQADGKDHRKSHEEKRLKAQLIYDQICVFESGLAELTESLAADLRGYLLRSLCADFCTQTLGAFADVPPDSANLPAKVRDELIGSIMESETRDALTELFSAQRSSLEQFHEAVQKLGTDCSFMIRQPDKKRRSEIIAEHKESLKHKIEDIVDDAPTTLLLIVLYLYATHSSTESIVHASGKFVGPLIKHLASLKEKPIPAPTIQLLNDSQRLVIECVKQKAGADDELAGELAEKLENLKLKIIG